MKRRSVRWIGVLTVVSTLAVTGCTVRATVTAPTPTQSAETFASADVMLAMMMIPHHEQAVAMSDVLLSKEDIDVRVRELAEGIRAAQQPEIELMESWLDEGGMNEFGDMGRMTPGAGMTMSKMDMSVLEDASGTDAERVFLEEMIVHHDGAIQMSQALLEAGSNPDARDLAEEIIVDQTDEIAHMRDLLAEY